MALRINAAGRLKKIKIFCLDRHAGTTKLVSSPDCLCLYPRSELSEASCVDDCGANLNSERGLRDLQTLLPAQPSLPLQGASQRGLLQEHSCIRCLLQHVQFYQEGVGPGVGLHAGCTERGHYGSPCLCQHLACLILLPVKSFQGQPSDINMLSDKARKLWIGFFWLLPPCRKMLQLWGPADYFQSFCLKQLDD